MAKTILITGGATGIGAALAKRLAGPGVAIAINFRRREAAAQATVAAVQRLGARAIAIKADMRDPAAIGAMFATVDREFGRIDALVNSAGMSLPRTRVEDFAFDGLQELMTTNVIGLMLCCREAVRRMSTRHGGTGGVVINVSSMAATIGGRPGASSYAASKAAVDAFTIGFAKEVASEKIRVIAVRPGVIDTEMTATQLADPAFAATVATSIPLGRAGRVDEAAAPIAFLLSDQASFMTGCLIDISGGGFHIASANP
jgi:NAD(P)-dependent dehydrogenase (short-subunit alcohol dehydrogenase family)